MRFLRILLATVACVVLFAAGTAAAGVNVKKVILKPGQCVTVAKVRVCAAKARTRTVTLPPTTVTAPPVTATVTVTTVPTPKVAFPDGTYRVGADVQPGTYQGVAASNSCYWERLKGFGGTLDEIIANYFGTGPTIVTISPSDVGFRSSGCGGWTKIG
jgi:hypothetical protein